jgi:aspartate aminotransferase
MMQHIVRYLQNVTVSIEDYQKKRDFLYQNLVDMGYQCVKPQGAFYLFPKSLIPDDVAFVRALQEEMVLAVPGIGFGGAGHFRISYCIDDRTLSGSLEGFRKTAKKFGIK